MAELRINIDRLNDLIISELQDKSRAIHGYDAILWKIRSGYVVVLYGALSLVSGKVVALTGAALLLFIVGIALAAFLIDYSFVLRKMRVVVAGDELIERKKWRTFTCFSGRSRLILQTGKFFVKF